MMDDDIEWHQAQGLPHGGVYHGMAIRPRGDLRPARRELVGRLPRRPRGGDRHGRRRGRPRPLHRGREADRPAARHPLRPRLALPRRPRRPLPPVHRHPRLGARRSGNERAARAAGAPVRVPAGSERARRPGSGRSCSTSPRATGRCTSAARLTSSSRTPGPSSFRRRVRVENPGPDELVLVSVTAPCAGEERSQVTVRYADREACPRRRTASSASSSTRISAASTSPSSSA